MRTRKILGVSVIAPEVNLCIEPCDDGSHQSHI